MASMTTLTGKPRKGTGTRAARTIREAGEIPAIIYGHGEAPEGVTLSRHDVEVALSHGARTLEVSVNGTKKTYLIKEVQYDHLQHDPIHMDLARVDLTERVRVRVGIELRGTAKGVSEGGVLEQLMGSIEVECVVTEIPSTLHPVITHLMLGDTLYVKDLPLPAGVTPLADPDERVAQVRKLAEEVAPVVAAVEGEAAPAEPERIGRIRKDEEEGEAQEAK